MSNTMIISILVDEEGNVAVYVDGSEQVNDLNTELAIRRVEVTIDTPIAQTVSVPEIPPAPITIR